MKKLAEPPIVEAVTLEMTRLKLQQAPSTPDLAVTYYLLLTTNKSTQTIGQFLPGTMAWGLPLFPQATQSLEGPESGFAGARSERQGHRGLAWRGAGATQGRITESRNAKSCFVRACGICCDATRRNSSDGLPSPTVVRSRHAVSRLHLRHERAGRQPKLRRISPDRRAGRGIVDGPLLANPKARTHDDALRDSSDRRADSGGDRRLWNSAGAGLDVGRAASSSRPGTDRSCRKRADDAPIPPTKSPFDALPEAVQKALDQPFTGDLDAQIKRRAIRVGVTYNRTHYFIDRGPGARAEPTSR